MPWSVGLPSDLMNLAQAVATYGLLGMLVVACVSAGIEWWLTS